MNKLQAAMKDSAARKHAAGRMMYKVGGFFKGCKNCGEQGEHPITGKRGYLTGHEVYRSISPSDVGWTFWCWDCGAKDLDCWAENAQGTVAYQLGKNPAMGSTEAKLNVKKRWIAEAAAAGLAAEKKPKPDKQKLAHIKQLEAQLRFIQELKNSK